MLRVLVSTSVRFRLLIIGLAGLLLLAGATQLQSARVDVLPEFAPTYVEVQTEALGLSAEEVEQLITVPIEADLLHGVAFLEEIRSESVPGLSSITLIFEPGTDLLEARQVVAERLTQAHALPNVSKPPTMIQPLSSTSRVMMVGLSSQDVSLIDMSVLARWTIRPRLLGRPRRRERVDLRAARATAPGPRRPRPSCAARASRSSRSSRPRATPCGSRR